MRKILKMSLFACAVLLLSAGCLQNKKAGGKAEGESAACSSCHAEAVRVFEATAHAQSGVTCVACHAGTASHLKNNKVSPGIDRRGESCSSCHSTEYAEWSSSPHARIPLDLLPRDPRVMECLKCHQAAGFAAVLESGEDFKKAWAPSPKQEPEAVTCTACHAPHGKGGSQLLRLEKAELCSSCHGGKWQNLVITAAGGYHYGDYSAFANHPHNSGDRCVTCHMSRTPGAEGVGGHTFSMRTPEGGRPNTAACAACHGETPDYNLNGRQKEAAGLLGELRTALEVRNGGTLPENQPGACNQCHRGGTLPFDHDPDLVLEHAYENYKLLDRDKSQGVHNAPYTLQLLRDALNSISENYRQ